MANNITFMRDDVPTVRMEGCNVIHEPAKYVGNMIASPDITYLTGPLVDRLHKFEELGHEPEQLEKIIKLYHIYKIQEHSVCGSLAKKEKPTYVGPLSNKFVCPRCAALVYPSMKYCSECGQSLDWDWDIASLYPSLNKEEKI